MPSYNDVINNAQSKDCSIKEFQDTMWQYIKEKMTIILKSGNVDANLVKTLVNYRGNSYGAHAMLLDMAPIKSLYEDIGWFILYYADAHKDSYKEIRSRYGFELQMNHYIVSRATQKNIEEEFRNNPLIENLYKYGHSTLANKAIRYLTDGDERTQCAWDVQREALHDMRAYDFFKTLKKIVEELGE